MRRLLTGLAGVAALALAGLLAHGDALGETWDLKLKRLESQSAFSQQDYQYRTTFPQTFYRHFQDETADPRTRIRSPDQEEQEKAFKRIVKKEPAEYACKHPLRAVVKLGSEEFALVLDAAPFKPGPKEGNSEKAGSKAKPAAKGGLLESLSRSLAGKEAPKPPSPPGKPIVYTRLFFDANGNGDLTDDKVIEGQPPAWIGFSSDSAYRQFPRVDVTVHAEGTKGDYAFTLSARSHAMPGGMSYVYASLNAAAYREGEITLEGKKHRVVLIDFNSNGRFDDESRIREGRTDQEGVVYPEHGDILMLDPDASLPVFYNPYEVTSSGNRYHVSKLVNVEGRYYELKVSPAGDKLTLTPAAASLGYVTNPNEGFTAVLYGDKGFVKISGGKDKPVPLPEGDWRLLSYAIDQTRMPEVAPRPEKKTDKKPIAKKEAVKPKSSAVMSALVKAITGSAGSAVTAPIRPLQFTRVSAQAGGDYKAVQVRKGETVALPFGPPYKPVVRVDGLQGDGQVRLGLSLVGSAGERCTDMTIYGSRPASPEFTISDPKGEVVQRGKFEFG